MFSEGIKETSAMRWVNQQYFFCWFIWFGFNMRSRSPNTIACHYQTVRVHATCPPKQNYPPPPPDKIKKWKFLTPQQRRFYILLSKCSLQLSYVVKKAKLAKYQNNISSPFLQLTMKPLYVIIMSRRLEWVCPIGGAHLTVPKDCKPFFLPHCNVAWRQAC